MSRRRRSAPGRGAVATRISGAGPEARAQGGGLQDPCVGGARGVSIRLVPAFTNNREAARPPQPPGLRAEPQGRARGSDEVAQVYRLVAKADASCPAGTKLVILPQPVGGAVRLLVPETVSAVVVILDEEGQLGWIEDSLTGRGIVDFVRSAAP